MLRHLTLTAIVVSAISNIMSAQEQPSTGPTTSARVEQSKSAEAEAQKIVAGLRREGIATEMSYRGNMKKRLSRANASGAAYALIIGDDELDRGEAQLKDLATGEQRSVSLELIGEAIGR